MVRRRRVERKPTTPVCVCEKREKEVVDECGKDTSRGYLGAEIGRSKSLKESRQAASD